MGSEVEMGSSQSLPGVSAVQLPASPSARSFDGGPGYDAGSVLWHSSEEDGGPDVGIQVGLGSGFSLYLGEVSNATLREHGVPPEYPDGWWMVLYGPSDEWIIGAVPDQYVARDAIEHIAVLIDALSGAQRSELSGQLRDEPSSSEEPTP